ncbi:MAG: ferrochelatase [Planctomycetales bacterium]|nr:ferrochelatase [Planctomycetales bacterium]MBN8625388.1 ferrochelatase [Planctomycetota bacterium]
MPPSIEKPPYEAILVVSFGGPEHRDHVIPFLENVLRGRNVPRERMLEVAEHYYHFGGVSPINAQNRALIEALKAELPRHGVDLPVYFGNRNWHPLLPDTLAEMRAAGVRRALAYFTSAFSSYSGCRQYRENILAAQEQVGDGAPAVDKIRVFYNHPGFVEAMADRVREALEQIPAERRAAARLIYTAHSIPNSMAANCAYEQQLRESSRLVTEAVGRTDFIIAYQSRSGPPTQPWLEPDVGDVIKQLHGEGVGDVVVVPIGFVSDHMEVIYDLDDEAKHLAEGLGVNMVRAGTVGTHPRFVRMIAELIVERIQGKVERPALGVLGPCHDVCPIDCCLPPPRPPMPARPAN